MTNETVTKAAREAFQASKDATGDDGAAFESANEAIKALVGDRTGFFDQETLTWTFDVSAVGYTILSTTVVTREHLPPDLRMEASAGGTAYRFVVDGNAQPGFVLVVHARAGVAWGADATWIDLRAGETAEDAARIVLNDADETERRA